MDVRKFLSFMLSGVLFFSALFGGVGGAVLLQTDAASAMCTEHVHDASGEEGHGYCDCCSEESDAVNIHDGALLSAVMEKSRYEKNEQIPLRIEALPAAANGEFSYTSVGFSVVNEAVSTFGDDAGAKGYQMLLVYDGVTEEPYFSFEVVTDTGITAYAEVYGYIAEDALFVSRSSHDAAREASYYDLVQSGQITMEQFNELLQQDYSRVGFESSGVAAPSLDSQDGTGEAFAASATTRVYGTLGWQDDAGVGHPMQYTTVEIWNSLNNKKLGTVYTDVNGQYSFSISGDSTYSIYIKVYPGGENAIVKTGNKGEYAYKSSVKANVVPGSSVNINWTVDMTTDLGRAFQVAQAVIVATRYVKEMNGKYISAITVYYPHQESNTGCFYNGSIYICGSGTTARLPASYASWDVVMHEYGHHVQRAFNITQSPGGSHSFSQNLAETRGDKSAGIRLAWGESYASVFGGMAQAFYISTLQNIATVGDTEYTSYNGAWMDYEDTKTCIGEACESSVIAVLWDLYDNTPSESHDKISFSHEDYWKMMTGSGATTLSGFCNYFNAKYSPTQAVMLGSLLSYYKMSASGLRTSSNTSQPTISWTANGTAGHLKNNKFDLIIFDEEYQEIFRVEGLTATSYTITQTDQDKMQNWGCGLRYVVVVAYQTSEITTGGYYSAPLIIGTAHDYEAWVVLQSPTCTKQGKARRDCQKCDFYQINAVSALGHDYDEGVTVAPKCEEMGYLLSTCSRCDYERKSNYVEATGHVSNGGVTVEPKCEEMGYHLATCQVCGEEYKSKLVAARGHLSSEWVTTKTPTKREDGAEQRCCEICGIVLETRAIGAYTHLIPFEARVQALTGACDAESYQDLVGRLNYYHKLEPQMQEAVREDYELLCKMIEQYNAKADACNRELWQKSDTQSAADTSRVLADAERILNGAWYSLCEKNKGRGKTA